MKIWIYVFSIIILSTGTASAGMIHNINKGIDYTMIQAAIDNASIGDDIHVDSGIYYENININKSLILRGIDTGSGKPIIDANMIHSPIMISADGIYLEGFKTINSANAEIVDFRWENDNAAEAGIKIISSNNTIIDNVVSSNRGHGIYSAGHNNTIDNNVIDSNGNHGIYIFNAKKIVNNVISNNNFNGIYASNYGGQEYFDINTEIINNNIYKNNGGMHIYHNYNSRIIGNNVSENNRGVEIINSYGITLKSNSLFGNTYNFGIDSDLISHNIDMTNLVDSRPIYYLRSVSNKIYDSTDIGAFYCIYCNNITIRNINIQKNIYGITLSGTRYAKIENSNIKNNLIGIRLIDGESIIDRNYISDNFNGIYTDNGYNSNIQNNTISNNEYGINIYLGSNNNINNNNIDSNPYDGHGIYLRFTNNNIITRNLITSIHEGIYMIYSKNNLIFDNYLGTDNVYFDTGNENNTWNITKISGTNIVGGQYVGGNYWSSFSQTCTNRGDGFCNSNYTLDSSNIDYLPLTNNHVCGNTPKGQNIQIVPMDNINIMFDSVIQCGNTTASISDNQWGPLPDNYNSIKIYNTSTTVIYTNSITINISYLDSDIPPEINESSIKLFHYENGDWIDITTFLDRNSNTITGIVTSLSPFAIAGESTVTPTVTPTVVPTTSPTETPTISPTITAIMNTVKGSSSNYIGFIILSICLMIISILILRKR